jgi:hypothetical protein
VQALSFGQVISAVSLATGDLAGEDRRSPD